MINVLLSGARVTVARQKKAHKGSAVKMLGSFLLGQEESPDYAALAERIKAMCRKAGARESGVNLILEDNVVFKEFSHQPVGEKAELGFARLEARTVLREAAGGYTVACMPYGAFQNDAGEVTGMLLAAPVALLRQLRTGFAAVGYTVESVHSMFDCYTATLKTVMPAMLPEITGAAIDFGHDHTLVSLFSEGRLVSQRRLNGVVTGLVPGVVSAYGCTEREAYSKLSDPKVFAAYAPQAKTALTGFTYDVLRTLRVLASPMRIQPQQFLLSGAMLHDKTFVEIVKESLGLPCTLAAEQGALLQRYFGGAGAGDVFVLAGPAYSEIDLLRDLRAQRTGSVINMGTCAVVTVVAVLGMLVQPGLALLKQQTLQTAQERHAQLAETQAKLEQLTFERQNLATISEKLAQLAAYTSNAGQTTPKVLALFGESFLLQTVNYDGLSGAYEVNFIADTKENFLALKDTIYANNEYYLNLSMSIIRQTEEGSYLCQIYFIPADYIPLPQPESADASSTVQGGDGTAQDAEDAQALLEEIQG